MSATDDEQARTAASAAAVRRAAAALGVQCFAPPPMVLRLEPAERRPIVEAEWDGTLIVVAAGEVALHCSRGGTRTFAEPAVVWFTGLDLVAYSNPGWSPTELVAVRRASDTPAAPVASPRPPLHPNEDS